MHFRCRDMSDIMSSDERSRSMSQINSKNTRPELVIRSGLHRVGFRFRLHDPKLLGRPDIVFPRFRALIFINGCFWHKHGCHMFKFPKTREDFWRKKLSDNADRDQRIITELLSTGWRVLIIWECSIKGKFKQPLDRVLEKSSDWLKSDSRFAEISCQEER